MTDKEFSFDKDMREEETANNRADEMDADGGKGTDEERFSEASDKGEPRISSGRSLSDNERGEYPYGGFSQSGYPYSSGEGNGSYRKPTADGYFAEKKRMSLRLKEFFYDKRVLELTFLGTVTGCAILLYHLFSYLMSVAVSKSFTISNLYHSDELFRNFFGMIYTVICVVLPFAAVYAVLKKAGIVTLPLDAPRKDSGLMLLFFGGMGIFYVGNVLTSLFVTALSGIGIGLYSYTNTVDSAVAVPENIFMFLVMSVHTAVLPAVAEEFAFRGVIMQSLRKYGDWFAIIASAVIFGLLHGNMMQMPFAIIAGIILGYVVVVTGSLWAGMILHFFNNFLSFVYSVAGEVIADGSRTLFSALYTYGIIIIGLVAIAGYALSNPDFYRLYPSRVSLVKTKKAAGVYFLVPPMLIAVIVMIISVIGDFYFLS